MVPKRKNNAVLDWNYLNLLSIKATRFCQRILSKNNKLINLHIDVLIYNVETIRIVLD